MQPNARLVPAWESTGDATGQMSVCTDISVNGTGQQSGLSSVPAPQTVLQSLVEKRDCPLPPTRTQHGGGHPGLLAWGDAEPVHVQHRAVTRTRSLQGLGDRRCASSGQRDRNVEFTGC